MKYAREVTTDTGATKSKRKKALKLFNDYQKDIVDKMIAGKIKYGNRSNMGFRYGLNTEVKNRKGVVEIRQYAVDFNGTKELLIR